MKKIGILFTVSLALYAGNLFSQDEIDDGTHRNFTVTMNETAHYPGTDQELYMDLFKRMKYPEEAKEKKVQGDIMVSFFVETDSTTSDVKAMGDLGYGTKDEAERLIKETRFVPAIQNGKPVRQQMMLPVLFRIYD